MSLRLVHLLFISISVVLTAFFAAWAGGQYRAEHELVYLATALVSLATGAGLVVYGKAFQRKTRNL